MASSSPSSERLDYSSPGTLENVTLTVVSTLFIHVVRSEIGGLRNEMNARFDAVDARFDAVNTRIDGLDGDVQAIVKRTFGLDRE
ncbi:MULTISPECIES: hypothetical protein [unclassified Microbacterium]|uniref:hypothetical protein n=1 Tax=unclassified Microbacterium TaxID=2609290 RepID=UPI00068ADFAF|nr:MULTISPECIES: hypothetical protein [unclassified Microbacterium]